jgi:hypothetical protein
MVDMTKNPTSLAPAFSFMQYFELPLPPFCARNYSVSSSKSLYFPTQLATMKLIHALPAVVSLLAVAQAKKDKKDDTYCDVPKDRRCKTDKGERRSMSTRQQL